MFPCRCRSRVADAVAGLLLAVAPIAHSQTSDIAAAITAAQIAARSWLALVDRGAYGESWDSGSAFFRRAVTKPAWEEALRTARTPFGPFGEAEERSWRRSPL